MERITSSPFYRLNKELLVKIDFMFKIQEGEEPPPKGAFTKVWSPVANTITYYIHHVFNYQILTMWLTFYVN